jgi:Bacterial regulatory helix-turn-helix protein, lysR family
MVLTIEYLKTFLLAADSGSFTKAAAAVHRTQSAVSMQMKRLEEEIPPNRLCEHQRHRHHCRLFPRSSCRTIAFFQRLISQT